MYAAYAIAPIIAVITTELTILKTECDEVLVMLPSSLRTRMS
jgi:hypothetical protein